MQSICQDDSAFCYIHKAFPLLFRGRNLNSVPKQLSLYYG